ncbi:MAG: hypothetical protein SF052_17455 [Bacteroidia bacterium]|nr:hypothetical protein [Bacteroidia bacterium]
MLRKFESLIPLFLRNLDHQLLTNRPGLWATRIHYVLYFMIIGGGLLFLQAITRSIRLTDVPNPDINTMILIIPMGIAFLFWAYRVSLFQIEKTFGLISEGKIRNQIIYAGVILALGFAPVVYGYILNQRIKQQISKEELIRDINALNIGENLFITDRYVIEGNGVKPEILESGIINIGYNRYTHYSFSSIELLQYHEINDILDKALSREDKLEIISNYINTFNKYSNEKITLSPQEILTNYETRNFENHDQNYYEDAKYVVFSNLENIQRAWSGSFGDFEIMKQEFPRFYLFALVALWMALQVFLNTNWKIFVGAAITGIASIITLAITYNLTVYAFNIHSNESSVIAVIVLSLFAFFTYQAFRHRHTERILAWKSISLSVITMATLILPMVIFMSIESSVSDDEGIAMLYTGAVAGILLWNLLYQPHFSKLAALPREN